ncbi:MAG: hypothetical protein ACJ8IR_02330 [Alphaproteobacteria bacterium]
MNRENDCSATARNKDVVPKRKPGGQPGNRNAFKTGRHVESNRAMRSDIAKIKRRVRDVIRLVDAVLQAQADKLRR